MAFIPKELKARAREDSGFDDFGDGPLDDGLEIFCWSLANEAGLDEKRQAAAEATIIAWLVERLRVEACLSGNAAILQERVVRPLFVLGLPRTGSTALSQFLSEDPQARSIRRWEVANATPPPDVSAGDTDPRLLATRKAFEERDRLMPQWRSMLPVNAEDPSEHGSILGLTFRNLQIPSLYSVPTYQRWLIQADMKPAFEYLLKVLKLLQWRTPAPFWNLKNPPDMFKIDALVSVFPDARIVWTHRDPADSIPSVCSLTRMIRKAGGETVDDHALGRMQLQFQSEGAQRGMEADQRLGEHRIVSFYQENLSRDTIGTLGRLYADVGLQLSDSYRDRLKQRLANRPRGQYGKHSYTVAEFGLTVADIRSAFRDYLERFEVPLEL